MTARIELETIKTLTVPKELQVLLEELADNFYDDMDTFCEVCIAISRNNEIADGCYPNVHITYED